MVSRSIDQLIELDIKVDILEDLLVSSHSPLSEFELIARLFDTHKREEENNSALQVVLKMLREFPNPTISAELVSYPIDSYKVLRRELQSKILGLDSTRLSIYRVISRLSRWILTTDHTTTTVEKLAQLVDCPHSDTVELLGTMISRYKVGTIEGERFILSPLDTFYYDILELLSIDLDPLLI